MFPLYTKEIEKEECLNLMHNEIHYLLHLFLTQPYFGIADVFH